MRTLPGICVAVSILLYGRASAAADKPAATTLIWHLDQINLVGGHVPTVLGSPEVVTERNDTAVHFNGSTDGLLIPVNPLEGLSEFTIEVLFKPEAGGLAEQRFLHVQDELGSRSLMEIRLVGESWALDTFLYSLKTESKCPLLDPAKLHPADRWTWVALVYANGHMAHYINGVKELEGEVTFPPTGPGQISLGVRQNKVYWFKGGIREVRVHPVGLSAEKLQQAESK